MVDNQTVDEYHECLVCHKAHHVQVTYDPQGIIVDCAPAGSDVRVLPAPDQLLIVCTQHQGVEVAAALAERYFQSGEHDHEHDH